MTPDRPGGAAGDQPARDSERRRATVLFADISGFTSMSEKMDPEDVTAVMNDCFAMLEEVVRTHGGHVDKYIGDCIMVLFGVPDAIEDAPQRAVNAAIEIRRRLARFSEEQAPAVTLQVHSGINSGLVIAGDVGGRVKRDFTVMGDAVNLASRLKDEAPVGAVYVGPETYAHTRGAFKYRKLRPLALKGKQEPVPAYELLSASEQLYRPRPVRAGRMVFSALVGRQRELETLAECVRRVAGGQGGIVSVMGEAGLGKSRLVAELLGTESVRRLTVLEGRSLSMGQGRSFHPFVDLLRRWAGIGDDDGDEHSAGKLEEAIAQLCPESAGELFPFVATLMGMRLTGAHAARIEGIDGEAMEKMILKSMKDMFQALSRDTPLVLVFEDLHWADLSSIKLLESLLRIAAQAPVLFLNVFRPDEEETSERILRCARENYAERHTEIRLAQLDSKQCETLIHNLLQVENLPHATRALIARKAEGNPFYIEEVVRSLIDQGAVEHREGRLRVTEKIGAVVIPGTIQGVIMARVDRLDEATRRLLQMGSVIGRSFYRRILEDIAGPDTGLDQKLDYLKERQLLEERRTRRTAAVRRRMFAEDVEYVFTHALVQETIYESILQKTRKQLHLKVAESIEANFGERLADFYGMLAYHYSRAERLEKAEDYLFKAGDEAARSAASSEALNYFREASRLYYLIHGGGGDPHKKAVLERNVGLALLRTGNLVESVDHFSTALEHLGERVPKTRRAILARFALDLGAVLFHVYVRGQRRRPRKGDEHEREVLAVRYNRARAQVTSDPQRMFFDTIGTIRAMGRTDPAQIDEACGMYGGAALLFSFSGVSFGLSRKILGIAETLVREGNVRDLFAYRSMRFLHNFLAGDWDERHAIPDELVEQDLRYGQVWDVNTYLGIECEWHIRRGQFDAAQARIEKLADIRDVYGFDFTKSNEDAMTAFLLLEQRRLEEALRAIDAYYSSRPEELLNVLGLGTRAKIQILLGDRQGAAATLDAAGDIVRRSGQVPPFHLSPYLVSQYSLDLAALEESVDGGQGGGATLAKRARRCAKSATRVAAKIARERTEVCRLNGRLNWLLGKRDQAFKWWERSIGEGEQLGARPELARTHMEVGRWLAASGEESRTVSGRGARGHMEQAEAMFAELGLQWDLQRLTALARQAA